MLSTNFTNNLCKQTGKIAAFTSTALLLVACEQLGESSSGSGSDGGDAANNARSSANSNNTLDLTENTETASVAATETVELDAFKDFNCTPNWTNRDGGLGLKVGSDNGTCETSFPGASGEYKIELLAQTEREGRSPYRISINDDEVSSGKFPFSQGKVNCKCYRQPWTKYCPDVVKPLDAGTHQINTGDIIEYYGEEEYLCGKHGAYSKWRGMVFKPAN